MSLGGVEIILGTMLAQVSRGWTSEFTSEWFHPETGKRIWVSLSMLRRIKPGPLSLEG